MALHQHTSKHECVEEGDCVEEDCDEEECGGNIEAPKKDGSCLGLSVDRKPVLPFTLFTSTVVGAVCVLFDQCQAISVATSGHWNLTIFFAILYAVTLVLGVYCAMCDPGMVEDDDDDASQDTLLDGDAQPQKQIIPPRAHKSWMYPRPVRRYDHYCRWLQNVIGFYNHREFLFMTFGLALIGMGGVLLDAAVLFLIRRPASDGVSMSGINRWRWPEDAFVFAHLCYSATLTGLVVPILKIHLGLVSRNELAPEWKENAFYVIRKQGSQTPVEELDEAEWNARFQSFTYDPKRNKYDKGVIQNWKMFLFSRRGDDCDGAF